MGRNSLKGVTVQRWMPVDCLVLSQPDCGRPWVTGQHFDFVFTFSTPSMRFTALSASSFERRPGTCPISSTSRPLIRYAEIIEDAVVGEHHQFVTNLPRKDSAAPPRDFFGPKLRSRPKRETLQRCNCYRGIGGNENQRFRADRSSDIVNLPF